MYVWFAAAPVIVTWVVICSGPWVSVYSFAGIWIVSGSDVCSDETIACRIEHDVAHVPVSSAVVFTTNVSAAAGEAAARRATIVVARIPFQRIAVSIASV